MNKAASINWLRTRNNGWIVFLISCLIVTASYFGFSTETMIWIQDRLGYYFCLGLAVMWIYVTTSDLRNRGMIVPERKGLLLAVLFGLSLQCFQFHEMRVFNDEPSHQMTARMMHEDRRVINPQVGYYLEGTTDFGSETVSYRMYFYPFLVSVLHDLTGFRTINGWIVNAVLGVVFFLLLFRIGQRLRPQYGGYFAIILVSGLPLLDWTATSAGYDFLNLTVLAWLFLSALNYLDNPGSPELDHLVLATLIAAYSRNESLLYFGFLGLVVLWGVCFVQRPIPFTGFTSIAPIFLIPVLATLKIFQALRPASVYENLGSSGFFQFEAIPENLLRVSAWLFDFSPEIPSWPILTLLGVLGLIALPTHLVFSGLQRRKVGIQTVTLALFCLVAVTAFTIGVLGQFWNPLAGEAVRFLLPIHLVLLLAATWFFGQLKIPDRFLKSGIVGLIFLVFWIGIPSRMVPPIGNNAAFAQHAKWSIDWLRQNDDQKTLYISQLNTLFLLHDYATTDWDRGFVRVHDLMQLVREGYYDKVVGFVIERYDVEKDTWSPVEPTSSIPPTIHFENLVVQRLAYNTRARFFQIHGFSEDSGATVTPETLPLLRAQPYNSFKEYYRLMQSLYPGYR